MLVLRCSVSPLVLALLGVGLGTPVLADSFSVPPAVGPQSVSGTDTGTVAAGASLDGGDEAAITWSAPATGAGVVLSNAGTVTSRDRAIDSASDVSGTLRLDTSGAIGSSNDALRIGGSFAGGVLQIDNSGSITSQKGQALDLDKADAASAAVNITNSGTLGSAGSDAVRLGGGTIAITNSGTIEATEDGKRAIKMDSAGNFDTLAALSITNQVGGLISGIDDGIKISSKDDSTAAPALTLTNDGTIRSTGAGQAIDLGGIASKAASIAITNSATGLITATADDGIQGANGMVVHNFGTISSFYADGTADTQNNSAIKIDGEDLAGGMSATILNEASGVISGAYHGIKASGPEDVLMVTNSGTISGRNGSGVNSNGSGTVVNYGTITGTFDPASSFGDGDGVDFDGAGTILNYGTIAALGSKGTKPGESRPSTSEGIAIGGGTIVNGDAATPGELISGANNGILADNSDNGDAFAALSVTNYGTIQGLDGYGIRMVNAAGTFGNTIINYGTITGTTYAVAMGDGDDRFVYEDGSSVVGAVKAEGGTDTLELGTRDGTFNLGLLGDGATYQNFEQVVLAQGSRWQLAGASDFQGLVQVEDATAELADADLPALFSVGAGSLLGTGTIGGLTVGAGGAVAPGAVGAVGTLQVAADVVFAAGSTYQVSGDGAGQLDLIASAGSATLDSGASVTLQAAPGSVLWGTDHVILSARDGVLGNFGALTTSTDYLFLTPSLGADANSVFIRLDRNAISFTRYAFTPNQRAVALSLDAYGSSARPGASTLYDTLVGQGSPAVVGTAFTQLAGDIHATVGGVLFNENTLVNDMLLGRLRQAGYAGAGEATAALGFGGPASAYAAAPAPVQAGPFRALGQPAMGRESLKLTAWAQGYGQWVDAGSAPQEASTHLGGVLVGLDATSGNLIYGMALGYSSSSTTSGDASADADTFRIAGYGAAAFDAVKLRAGADIGWSSISSSRVVLLTGERPQADSDGTSANVFGEIAVTLNAGAAALEPFAGMGWSHVDLDGFTEGSAPVAGLSSGGQSMSTPYSTLGLRAAATFSAGEGVALTPHASAGWRHAFGDVTPASTLTFLSTGSSFGVEGVPVATDGLVVSGGLDLTWAGGWTLGVAYDGSFGDGVTANAARGMLSLQF